MLGLVVIASVVTFGSQIEGKRDDADQIDQATLAEQMELMRSANWATERANKNLEGQAYAIGQATSLVMQNPELRAPSGLTPLVNRLNGFQGHAEALGQAAKEAEDTARGLYAKATEKGVDNARAKAVLNAARQRWDRMLIPMLLALLFGASLTTWGILTWHRSSFLRPSSAQDKKERE